MRAVVVFAITVASCLTVEGCTKEQGTKVESAAETVGVDALLCVLENTTLPPEQIAVQCATVGLSDIKKILAAHQNAETREAQSRAQKK